MENYLKKKKRQLRVKVSSSDKRTFWLCKITDLLNELLHALDHMFVELGGGKKEKAS